MESPTSKMPDSGPKPIRQEHCTCCSRKRAKSEEQQEALDQSVSTTQEMIPATGAKDEPKARSAVGFLDLPAELRCLVYEELLVVGKVYYKDYSHQKEGDTIRLKDKEYFREPYLSILQTCKQVHDEAEKLYLSKNLFVLPSRWQYYAPFMEHEHHLNNRHLFSKRGLAYIRNLSISMDRDELWESEIFGYTATTWKLTQELDYDSMTATERFKKLHELAITNASVGQCLTTSAMRELEQAPFEFVEIDWTNALCFLDCCRPLDAFVNYWVYQLRLAIIYNIGMRSNKEAKKIRSNIRVDWECEEEGDTKEDEDTTEVDVKKHTFDEIDIQFSQSGPTPKWDQWKHKEK